MTPHAGFDDATLARIAPTLAEVVNAGDLSGVVTLVWRAGEVARVDCLGHADIAAGRPMQRDTIFRIASMTKPVTSVAALQLVEAGRIALDDPVSRHLPEFAGVRVLRRADGPLDDLVPCAREMTVEDLFTHRAGLAYAFTSVGPLAKAYAQALPPGMAPEAWLSALAGLPLAYQPGERFHYSHATDVLGLLAARVAGTDLRTLLRQRIFEPLGMHDTDFHVPVGKRDRAAEVYRQNTDGVLEVVPMPHLDAPPAFCAGGGGLVSTADDYLRFARMLLGNGEVDGVRLLRAETVAAMRTNRLTDEQRRIPFMGMPFWEGQGFGLGLSVVTDPDRQPLKGVGERGAFGWPGAFGTWWQADPERDLILLFMIQNAVPLTPDMASQLATGQRLGARAALPTFQRLVYDALR